MGAVNRWACCGFGALASVVACAGSQNALPVQGGDTQGPPRVEALPSLDVDDTALSKEMRMARMLSEESLNLPAPPLPSGRTAQDIQHWSEETLAPWLQSKQARAEAARAELDVAALQNQRQRIVAGALVGLVYEDVAQGLLRVPAPRELDSEPEVLAMYHDLLQQQAAPYLMHARLGYDACAANAHALRSLEHWSAFCGERSSHLPSGERLAPGESETSVTVTRD
ncbi:MAG: hypothetical protein QM778_27145 [Myxococcales bacterium]